jgi:hypothetical protein
MIFLCLAGFTLVLSSCDAATDSGTERPVESQGGGDVGGDDAYSVQTQQGETTVDPDASLTSGALTELPDEWPTGIPEPDGLTITAATIIGSDTERSVTVIGSVSGKEFVDRYARALESARFSQESTFSSTGISNDVYSNGEWTVAVGYFGDHNGNQVTVSVANILSR